MLINKKYIEKNITYLNILRPLKIEIKDYKLSINGLKKLFEVIKLENFLVYKNVYSVKSGLQPHLAVVNDTKTSGQILTSSKEIRVKTKEELIFTNILHRKNLNKPQHVILSSINPEHVQDFVMTNTWYNLKIENTEEFVGLITKLNLQYLGYCSENFLVQNRSVNFKDIIYLTNSTNTKLKVINDPVLENRFTLLHGQVNSFGEKILQDEAKLELAELNKEIDNLDFKQI